MTETGVDRLRGIELGVPDLERTARFYEDIWGLRLVHRDDASCYFRASGPEYYVLALHRRRIPGVVRVTFGARNRVAIERIHDRVCEAGAKDVSSPGSIEAPGGGYGFTFRDFEDREFCISCESATHPDAVPANDRPYKLSHVVFNSVDFDQAASFFQSALGFRLRDRTRKANFLGCNADHHCIAFTDRRNTSLSHAAFELPSLDAVLRGCGRLKRAGLKLEWGVGRHGTGDNVFAYFIDPNDFVIEYTAEMQQVDDASYIPGTPETITRPPHNDVWGLADPPSARFLEAIAGKMRSFQ